MGRIRLKQRCASASDAQWLLLVLTVVYGLGMILGAILVRYSSMMGSDVFSELSHTFTWQSWLRVFWAQFRWCLLAGVLACTTLGLFAMVPLVFYRGVLIGSGFFAWFADVAAVTVVGYYGLSVLCSAAPLLLIALCGILRRLGEDRLRSPSERFFARVSVGGMVLFAALILCALCSAAQLWLLSGAAGSN